MPVISGTAGGLLESIEMAGSIIVYLLSSAILASATGYKLRRLNSFLLPERTFVSASESNPIGVRLLDL